MRFSKIALPCLLVLACNTAVKADGNNLALAYLFGYGGYGNTRIQPYIPAPPYFALHPPVYYGERYTRPYGASPFASWPLLSANAAYAPQPHVSRAQTFYNPYCPAEEIVAPVNGVVQVAPIQPLEIANPYFQPEVRYTRAKRE